jgi:hypothetical protein
VRFSAPNTSDRMSDYQQEWERYKTLRNQFVFVFAGAPIVFTFQYLTVKLFHTTFPALILNICWTVLLVLSGFRMLWFPCPRCGKMFFAKWYFDDAFARRCVHCGLPKYSN